MKVAPMNDAVIRPKRLYEEVVARMTATITAAQFEAGDRLPSERELMQQFGVGRPAIREALLTLQRMGLVEVRSGMRARVTKPTAHGLIRELSGAARQFLADDAGVRQLQDARMLLEIGLARHAAVHATGEEIEKLREALVANRNAIGDDPMFARTDVEFHFVLPVISGNSIFLAVYEALVEWLTEQRLIALQDPIEDRVAYAAHEAIFKAIAARDPEQAEREMRAHLAQVAEVYWRAQTARSEKRRRKSTNRAAPELAKGDGSRSRHSQPGTT